MKFFLFNKVELMTFLSINMPKQMDINARTQGFSLSCLELLAPPCCVSDHFKYWNQLQFLWLVIISNLPVTYLSHTQKLSHTVHSIQISFLTLFFFWNVFHVSKIILYLHHFVLSALSFVSCVIGFVKLCRNQSGKSPWWMKCMCSGEKKKTLELVKLLIWKHIFGCEVSIHLEG